MNPNHRIDTEHPAASSYRRCRVRYQQLLILLTAVLIGGAPLVAQSTDQQASLEKLRNFTTTLVSFTADFQQTVYDAESNPLQSSTGAAMLKRPGKFLWHYKTPSEQKIIADGQKVWIYDIELDQVTVSPLDDRASGTPLALLMGESPLDDEFTIKVQGESDGIDWYELTPKSNDTDFEKIFIGLSKKGLAVMELRDNFSQATQIRFDNYQGNVKLNDSVFNFEPPAGVDVIGEG